MNHELINMMFGTISKMAVVLNEVTSQNCHGRKEMNRSLDQLSIMMHEMNKPPTQITAEEVKRLRAHTGEGLMASKKALVWAKGDFNKAVEYLRNSGNI